MLSVVVFIVALVLVFFACNSLLGSHMAMLSAIISLVVAYLAGRGVQSEQDKKK